MLWTSHSQSRRSFIGGISFYEQPAFMPVIGYARVSTKDQPPLPQSQASQRAWSAYISGSSDSWRENPSLRRLRLPGSLWPA